MVATLEAVGLTDLLEKPEIVEKNPMKDRYLYFILLKVIMQETLNHVVRRVSTNQSSYKL